MTHIQFCWEKWLSFACNLIAACDSTTTTITSTSVCCTIHNPIERPTTSLLQFGLDFCSSSSLLCLMSRLTKCDVISTAIQWEFHTSGRNVYFLSLSPSLLSMPSRSRTHTHTCSISRTLNERLVTIGLTRLSTAVVGAQFDM